jgi:hypothetical protein
MSKSFFIRLLASSILATTLGSTIVTSAARADERLDLKTMTCMSDEALKQIKQLEAMQAQDKATIDSLRAELTKDQKALEDASEAIKKDNVLIQAGANAWPAGFNPQEDLGFQQTQVNFLGPRIPQEQADIQKTEAHLQLVEAWLQADRALGPCPPENTSFVAPGGKPGNDLDDLLNGPPTETPALASDPGPVPPVVDPPAEVDHPRSGFVDPPATVLDPPGAWDRFWKKAGAWCRDFFECQTEEEQKAQHDAALQKAREDLHRLREQSSRTVSDDVRKTETAQHNETSRLPISASAHATSTEAHSLRTAWVRGDLPQHAIINSRIAMAPRDMPAHLQNFAHMSATGLEGARMHGFGGESMARSGGFMTHGLGETNMGGLGGMHMAGLGGFGGGHMGGFDGFGGGRMGGMGGFGGMFRH